MDVVSFFSGAGGLDKGFEDAGFNVIWANEYDKSIWETFELNHKKTKLVKKSIADIPSNDVPDCDGIIGGPPCQSWSEAGELRGVNDTRGQLFFEFIRILSDKQPKFFLAENVSGMLLPRHSRVLANIKAMFIECGYNLVFKSINASDYGVPQDRQRVFFIGYRKDLKRTFAFPEPTTPQPLTLKDAIWDLRNNAIPALEKNHTKGDKCKVANHEYMIGGFSSMYMSRNRVRAWNECSYTIQAMGRNAPLHPQAPKMELIAPDKRIFIKGKEDKYRRLSIRECARIQTFPDDFVFKYKMLSDGYKMVGNAVPVKLAYTIANKIFSDLSAMEVNNRKAPKKTLNDTLIKERMLEMINAV